MSATGATATGATGAVVSNAKGVAVSGASCDVGVIGFEVASCLLLGRSDFGSFSGFSDGSDRF